MRNRKRQVASTLVLLVFVYFSSGIYTLDNGQHAIILRFGSPVKEINSPGIHYRLPFPLESIQRAHIANVQTIAVNNSILGRQECFSGDENLVTVSMMVSFNIKSLTNYLF